MIQVRPSSVRRRVAIVGSGISGMVCAERLHRECDITVFEANDYIGGHTNTVELDLDGRSHAIDTGFIVFNELNYPNFVQLLDRYEVESLPTTMSFSVRCERSRMEYNGTSLNTLFSQRTNLLRPSFHRMILDILRFNREAQEVLHWSDATMDVAEYVRSRRYSRQFVEHYLVPMGASIWSCPANRFARFPIRFVVEFFHNHRMLTVDDRPQWRVIRGGSQRYVEAITAPFRDRIRTSTPVLGVRRTFDAVELQVGRNGIECFDHVIFACHSDQALDMLQDPSPLERRILRAFPYQSNEAVLHTDTSLLPRSRRAWAAWNYRIPVEADAAVTVTYNMNILQRIRSAHTFCVTLNDADRIDRSKVIERFDYAHPVFTQDRHAAEKMHAQLIDVNRTSYCGAYWGYGFHEDGVASALRVCRSVENAVAA